MNKESLTREVQRLATTTGFAQHDLLRAVEALRLDDAQSQPWPDEAIERALPTITHAATLGRTSLRAAAMAVRASAGPVRPGEEPTT